jgi:glycerate 2-kinase
LPLADGGEGTVAALVSATSGILKTDVVTGPRGDPVKAQWGILGDGATAVIEMAAASGLTLLPEDQRNPLLTTTFGTGELLLHAMRQGCRKIIIGIGGSATTDCGAGMAQALGVRFWDRNGAMITDHMNGDSLAGVCAIDFDTRSPLLKNTAITVACDVDNPLLGPRGAVQVYAPQKGAKPEQLPILENNLTRFITLVEQKLQRTIRDIPGSGAAGGLGAGLLAFAQATTRPGIDLVLQACGFVEQARDADLIITGEGQVDEQTIFGKTISGILKAVQPLHKPVIAIVGNIGGDLQPLYERGVTAVFSICPGPLSLLEAMQNTCRLAENTMVNILRLLNAVKK